MEKTAKEIIAKLNDTEDVVEFFIIWDMATEDHLNDDGEVDEEKMKRIFAIHQGIKGGKLSRMLGLYTEDVQKQCEKFLNEHVGTV